MNAVILLMICINSLLHGEVHGNRCLHEISSHPFYKSVEVDANTECPIVVDCKGWYDTGATVSGIYPVKPDTEGDAFQVYCDMETDGGGWTVLMRRQDGSVDFTSPNWADYEAGFGELNGEFWLGLSKMHHLTPCAENTLRVDLGDFENNKAYELYREFQILDAAEKYAIVVNDFSGTAGDSLYDGHNHMKFSTEDKDNDIYGAVNCAVEYSGGGWWYRSCFSSRLTGTYYLWSRTGKTWGAGVNWETWKGSEYSLKFAEMKIRRNI